MSTISTPETDELTLPNHPETRVWLKRRPKFGDRRIVQSAAILARDKDGNNTPAGFARFLNTQTLVMIHDWTVNDDTGRKAPVSIEALEALDPADGDFLSEEAQKRYGGETGSRPLVSSSDNSSVTESSSPTLAQSESPN